MNGENQLNGLISQFILILLKCVSTEYLYTLIKRKHHYCTTLNVLYSCALHDTLFPPLLISVSPIVSPNQICFLNNFMFHKNS